MTFSVSGKLWNRSLVMMDQETRSLWSHLLGECMQGELKGEVLKALPCEMVTWKAWKQDHPKTTVLNMSRTNAAYTREFYQRSEMFVVGLVEGARPFHCSFTTLLETPILNVTADDEPLLIRFDRHSTSVKLFSRTLGEKTLVFHESADGVLKDDEGNVWDATGRASEGPLAGKQLEQRVGIISFKRAWLVFHPESRELMAEENERQDGRAD